MPDRPRTIDTSDQKKRVRDFFAADEHWQGAMYRSGDNSDPYVRMIARSSLYNSEMIQTLPDSDAGIAIDVGCGSGIYFHELVRKGYRVYGMDLSFEMIQTARARAKSTTGGQISLLQADVEALPIRATSADVIICVGVLAYLLDDETALQELGNVLKKGGHLLINVTNMMELGSLDYLFRKKIGALLRGRRFILGTTLDSEGVREHSSTRFHFKTYHPWKFEQVMQSKGFELVDARTLGFEFRILRRMKLLPVKAIDRLELLLERFIRNRKLPYLSYSGRRYIGLFRKS